MATHDYVIDNQSAPAFRADLNNALQAIVSQNSSASAPTTTYANMFWYDTASNQLKKRNEANSAWVTLGTVDEALGIFTPSGGPTVATQAEAEAGTNNTKMMTPLRVEQHMLANDLGRGQTWQDVKGSRTINTSYQNTTARPILVAVVGIATAPAPNMTFQVSENGSTWVVVMPAAATSSGVFRIFVCAVVPAGNYYRLADAVSIGSWTELR